MFSFGRHAFGGRLGCFLLRLNDPGIEILGLSLIGRISAGIRIRELVARGMLRLLDGAVRLIATARARGLDGTAMRRSPFGGAMRHSRIAGWALIIFEHAYIRDEIAWQLDMFRTPDYFAYGQ